MGIIGVRQVLACDTFCNSLNGSYMVLSGGVRNDIVICLFNDYLPATAV